MNNTLILLRHGKANVVPEDKISEWVLSDVGLKQAQQIARNPDFVNVDLIFASSEGKARQTIQPLAVKHGIDIVQFSELAELDRDSGGFIGHEAYHELVQATLKDRDSIPKTQFGEWESAASALQRVKAKVTDIDQEHEGKTIVICGHGITLNLFLADFLGEIDNVHDRFRQNSFADYAIIKEGVLVKDLF